MVAYLNSWIVREPSKKKELLDECWRLEKRTIDAYDELRDDTNQGNACNYLMACLIDRLDLEGDATSREEIINEALQYAEKAIGIFSKLEDNQPLALAYNLTGLFCKNGAFARSFDANRRDECRKKALSYPEKAMEVSEKINDAYLFGKSCNCLASAHADILGTLGSQEKLYIEKALQQGNLTKDNLLIADALLGLLFCTMWSAMVQEDPDRSREEYEKADKYCEEAIGHYSRVFYDLGIARAYCFVSLQRIETETNMESKRRLIEKYVQQSYKSLEHLRQSGSIILAFHVMTALSRALQALAEVETAVDKKRSLLQDSAKYMEQGVNALKQGSAIAEMEPRELNLSVGLFYLAKNQVELAGMEEKIEEKIKILRSAVANMRDGNEFQLKWTKSPWAAVEKAHLLFMGEFFSFLGKTLDQLHSLTNDTRALEEAVDAFHESVETCRKAETPSRIAEAYWQLAKTYDRLTDYVEAAKNFEMASENYVLASEKIPSLRSFYSDHATYMQAWGEIEKARHCHTREEYDKAKEHYEKVADLHKSTERWKRLSCNYLAWARLEEAEDLSRREETEEAIDFFHAASDLFLEAKKSARGISEETENKDEKEMSASLANASDLRCAYCFGRIDLEEARILDRQGDHAASSRKYGLAAERLQKVTDALKQESDRQELKPIVYLCRAWQMMSRAEADASPDLYEEASKLFEEAKDVSPNEKAKLLALGHSRFCKALEAGARFQDSWDTSFHYVATQHLETAASYYLKAGFKNASEYAEATQKLLDAYLYMRNAKTETDPAKKTRLYIMTEKLLQASAGSYFKAKYPLMQDQISKLLEKVRKERELALSLTEVLHAPLATSTTATFTTPTPKEEKPVGLERFEHADVQANLILKAREAKVGDSIELEIELVNVGKAPALLIKVEEIVPEHFEIVKAPDIYRIEDRYLNMKGKRVDPLKTEEVKIAVTPKSRGMFSVKPRILYLDETGKYRSHEPEPVTITVKELGISGWIKGKG
jgi:hypothetical protein